MEVVDDFLLGRVEIQRAQIGEHHHPEGRQFLQRGRESFEKFSGGLHVLPENGLLRRARQPGQFDRGIVVQRQDDEFVIPG